LFGTIEVQNKKRYIRNMAKKQYRFISEMGESTCKVCRSYHGKVFSENKLPKLPPHPNCRCRAVAGEPSPAKPDEQSPPMEKIEEPNIYYSSEAMKLLKNLGYHYHMNI